MSESTEWQDSHDGTDDTSVSYRDRVDLDDWERQYDDWHGEYGDEDPYAGDDDEKPRPDDVPPSDYEDDDAGTYNPAAGAQSQEAALRAGRCGARLKRSQERYGEPRFCTRLPEAVFVGGGSERCYEHKDGG